MKILKKVLCVAIPVLIIVGAFLGAVGAGVFNKYTFTVEDVIDTSETYRDMYNKVASKASLVNKLLIKRIQAIKTYNVGGKNPGARAGRLDRKAMYRTGSAYAYTHPYHRLPKSAGNSTE